MPPCCQENGTSFHCGLRDQPHALVGWHMSLPQLLGTSSAHPHSCSPVQSGHGGIYPRQARCFCFQMKKTTHQEGTCLNHCSNDMGSRLAPESPIARTQGQVDCWGALLPDHCISHKPRTHWQSRAWWHSWMFFCLLRLHSLEKILGQFELHHAVQENTNIPAPTPQRKAPASFVLALLTQIQKKPAPYLSR